MPKEGHYNHAAMAARRQWLGANDGNRVNLSLLVGVTSGRVERDYRPNRFRRIDGRGLVDGGRGICIPFGAGDVGPAD